MYLIWRNSEQFGDTAVEPVQSKLHLQNYEALEGSKGQNWTPRFYWTLRPPELWKPHTWSRSLFSFRKLRRQYFKDSSPATAFSLRKCYSEVNSSDSLPGHTVLSSSSSSRAALKLSLEHHRLPSSPSPSALARSPSTSAAKRRVAGQRVRQ